MTTLLKYCLSTVEPVSLGSAIFTAFPPLTSIDWLIAVSIWNATWPSQVWLSIWVPFSETTVWWSGLVAVSVFPSKNVWTVAPSDPDAGPETCAV